MSHKQSCRGITAAGAVLAAGLIPLAAIAVAHADGDDDSSGAGTDFLGYTGNLGLFTDTTAVNDFLALGASDTAMSGSELFGTLADTGFISNVRDLGPFTITTAANPDVDFVALVLQTPHFTDILTSGADPADNLGLGEAGIGVAGQTVNTFESSVFPFLDSTFALPFPDPLAGLYTLLVELGF